MKEFNKILDYDREIAFLESQMKDLKLKQDLLKMKRDKLAIESAPMLSEVGKIDTDGIRWSVQKGRPSIDLKEGITVEALPENFVRKAPDKVELLKVWKQSPELVESFAQVNFSPDKITYKLIEP